MPKAENLESNESVDETTSQNAPAEETNEETSEGEADTSSDGNNTEEEDSGADNSDDNQDTGDGDIDYKAELQDEKARRIKAEDAIIKIKQGRKNKPEDTEEEVIPLTQDDINKTIDTRLERDRLDAVEDFVDSQLELITSNVDEQNLIRHHYENSVKKTGYSKRSIKTDLANAYTLANRNKVLVQNRELKKTLKAKNSISNTGIGSNQSKPTVPEKSGLTADDITFLEERGKNPEDYTVDSSGNVTKKETKS